MTELILNGIKSSLGPYSADLLSCDSPKQRLYLRAHASKTQNLSSATDSNQIDTYIKEVSERHHFARQPAGLRVRLITAPIVKSVIKSACAAEHRYHSN